jgi:oligopeptide transport system substrate-binding protein
VLITSKGPLWVLPGWTLLFFIHLSLAVGAIGGESVFYAETKRIAGFDPAKAMDLPSIQAQSKMYEGLVQYAYLARPYRVEPCLAEALPTISADGTVYTFKIRSGIYFQDDPCFVKSPAGVGKGRELCAADFVYGIKRVADLKVGSPGYWAFRDRIVGLDEFRSRSGTGPTDYDAPVAGLETPDRYTLCVHLVRPFPAFLWILTMNFVYAVPREAVEYYDTDFVSHPVGTGPYILKSHIHNYRLEFERNPKWRETGREERYPASGETNDVANGLLADAGRPLPFIDRLVQYVITDPSTQWLLFLSGQLDATALSRDNWDAVVTPDRKLTTEMTARGIELVAAPALDTAYLGFNMEDPVVGKNRYLRQAMMAAFDRECWIRFQNGRVTPATGPIPPAMRVSETNESLFPFNLERARSLMIQAGYPDGKDPVTGRRLELTLELGSGESETREMAEVLASFMERIGIVLVPSFNNWPSFLKKLEQKRAQIFYLSWMADYPDPENFLQLFYGPNVTPGANRCNYVNPEFDLLYEKAGTLPEGSEKRTVYAQMEQMVKADCPWLFLHHSLSVMLKHSWLKNFKPHDFPLGLNKYYRVEGRKDDRQKL